MSQLVDSGTNPSSLMIELISSTRHLGKMQLSETGVTSSLFHQHALKVYSRQVALFGQ